MSDCKRDELIIDLFKQGKSYRDIVESAHCSNTTVQEVLRNRGLVDGGSKYSESLKMFTAGNKPLEVAVALNISSEKTMAYYTEWLNLNNMGRLAKVYEDVGNDGIPKMLLLHKVMSDKDVKTSQLDDIISAVSQWPKLKKEEVRINNEVSRLKREGCSLKIHNTQLWQQGERLKSAINSYQIWNQKLSMENNLLITDNFNLKRYWK